MRRALTAVSGVVCLAAAGGCAVTPGQIHALADADAPAARRAAVVEAVRWLRDPQRSEALRSAAARALGRLRVADPQAVATLAEVVGARAEPRGLRCFSAWALGELRSARSLEALTAALRAGLDAPVAEYVLEGLVKHTAVMADDRDRLLAVVEALAFHAGSRRGALPPVYQLLDDQTRSVEVNVEVVERTLAAARRGGGSAERAALYNAAFELLARLDDRQAEIAAGPAAWAPRLDAAVEVSGRVYTFEDLRTQLLVLYLLGRIARSPQVAARTAAPVTRWRATKAPQVSLQLVAVWALHRLQLSAVGPRLALVTDVLTQTADPTILRLVADLSRGAPGRQTDAPQRWLELGGVP